MENGEITCVCRILRYVPNLLRDEHMNIGVLLHEPASERIEVRVVESESEFAHLRRIHPAADLGIVRGLEAELRLQWEQFTGGPAGWLDKMEQTLSGAVQFGPQRAVLTKDFDAELDRIYRDQVAPLRGLRAEAVRSRAGLRTQVNEVLQQAGILQRLRRGVRVDEFTHPGDPMRLDYGYRCNGTLGFMHTVALDRDPAQAKALAFTGERIRAKAASVELTAVCEAAPARDNRRHRFVADLLADQHIALVPLPLLGGWARDLSARLQ